MEPPTSEATRRIQANQSSQRGVALVIVLAFLVLITVVIVAFLSSVTTEYSTASSAAAGATSLELADASVQMVIGQIRQATSLGANVVWASQPGMIRTYGSGSSGSYTASSSPLNYYKLYSSDNMVVSLPSSSYDSSTDVPATWSASPALFTDLNAPIVGSDSQPYFPIIDPRAAATVSGYSLVDGFTFSSSGTTGTVFPSSSTDTAARLPMPAKWIYVLRDGTLTAPVAASSTATAADFSTLAAAQQPTANNPIVGRIAFWTDDETCKLNINTSVGASPWDQPMFNSGLEAAFSRYQPAAHEYGRYPGHPAGTSLSPVFWSLSSMPSPDNSLASNPVFPSGSSTPLSTRVDWAPALPAYARDYWQKALRLSPRNELGDASSVGTKGGSQMGTNATAGAVIAGSTTGVGLPCPVDSDRLYASVDELMFTPSRTGRNNTNTYEFHLTKTDLEKIRFFLTVASRAPDVNLFNQPKVTIWPVPDLNNKSVANSSSVAGDTRSASDKLIAFCSTLNGNPYHFTRYDATSPTTDFGNSGSRNAKLYDYLNGYMSRAIPGFGGNFVSRYGTAGSSQILTEIYDYIRSCVNIQDSSAGTESDILLTRMRRSYTTLPTPRTDDPKRGSGAPGQGQVIPFLHPSNGTKGLGHFPTIKQVAIMFIARGANQPPLQVVASGVHAGRPLLFDSGGNSLLDAAGELTSAGVTAVLSGTAQARANDMHPFSADPVIDQLKFGGLPVLAVNTTKLQTNSNDTTAIYPVFTTYTAAGNVNAAYPTLYSSSETDLGQEAKVTPDTPNPPGEITIDGTTYKYYAAKLPSGGTRPLQTHAGLQYLTVPRTSGNSALGNMEGAYDWPNPRYQIATDGQQSLNPYETQVQAVFFVDPVNNAPGFTPLYTDYQVRIRGLNAFSVDGLNMEFTADATDFIQYSGGNAVLGGGSMYDIGALTHLGERSNAENDASGRYRKLKFFSRPKVAGTTSLSSQGATFSFTGTTTPLVIDLLSPSGVVVQTYNIDFPSGTFPTPKLPFIPLFGSLAMNAPSASSAGYDIAHSLLKYTNPAAVPDMNYPPKNVKDLTPSSVLTFTETGVSGADPLSSNPNYGVGGADIYEVNSGGRYRTRLYFGSYQGAGMELALPERDVLPGTSDYKYKLTADTIRSVECLYGDTRVIAALKNVPSEFFARHKFYDISTMRSAHSIYAAAKSGTYADAGKGTLTALRGATCSYLTDAPVTPTDPKTSYLGRMVAADGAYGFATWGYPTTAPTTPVNIRTLLGASTGQWTPLNTFGFPHVTSSVDFDNSTFRNTIWTRGGDFDNGPNYNPDGPYINKAPETTAREDVNLQTIVPDFNSNFDGNSTGDSLFSPNRQIASPVIFGSLPAGFKPAFTTASPSLSNIDPWRTLLFCPNPNSQTHPALSQVAAAGTVPAAGSAPDYLMLDFFQMPIVEPYAIGEPFSTAGKVNMNYQIVPFTFIKRDTALRGVLRSVLVNAVDDKFIANYKGINEWFMFKDNGPLDIERASRGYWDFRYPVHPGETLKQFDARFQTGDIFRSASEICSLWLYPARQPTASSPDNPKTALVNWDSSNSNIANWWYANPGTTRKSLTGDNMRERPYDTLYPRLTTKSNSYTVHFRVQVLKKVPGTNVAQWVENKDKVLSEYRGSSLIERYIDPSDSNLPDFATTTTASLDSYYKFRVVSTKKFTVE